MRDLINLVENAMAIREDAVPLLDLYDILYGYVTDGQWQDRYAQQFDTLYRCLPRPEKPMRLYRVLSLSLSDYEALQAGHDVPIEDRPYSSWTKSKACVANLVARRRQQNKKTVVIQMRIEPADIVVDIDAFYREHGFADSAYDEYGMYVRQEKEIIVRHQGFRAISPKMLVPFEDDIAALRPPKVGDTFVNSSGERERIKFVNQDQPYADQAVFFVTDRDGNGIRILGLPGGQWREQ